MRRALALLALAACGLDSEWESVVERGIIDFYADPVTIDVAATPRAGEPFAIHVTTFGGGCIELERTDVSVSDDAAVIEVYDRRMIPPPNGGACTLDLQLLDHVGEVEFAAPGDKLIVVRGRRVAMEVDEVVDIEVNITVE